MALETINPINCGENTSFEFYEDIVNSKRGRRKKILKGEIVEGEFVKSDLYVKMQKKYELYDECVKKLECLLEDKYTKIHKEALHHCYDSSTAPLANLKSEIIKNQKPFYQSKCAYCGIDGIDGMDHYIPKDKFPEYSVHPLNLIPACSFCNEKKSDKFLSGTQIKERIFFNPYFDNIGENVLKLDIDYCEDSNSFSFKLNVTNDSYLSHIIQLDIKRRYEEEAVNVFDNLRVEIIASFQAHFDSYDDLSSYEKSFRIQLEKSIDLKCRERGMNSIDFLVYDAFYNSAYCSISFFIQKFGDTNCKTKLFNK